MRNQRNPNKHKHMTLEDRIEIEQCLAKGVTFKDIGKRIGKSATTISREVKAHLRVHTNSFVKTEQNCPQLLKAPFACNGCERRSRGSCIFPRHLYIAKNAQREYETLLKESRTGIPLCKKSFYEMEKIVSSAVLNGQHIYHILQTNQLPLSTATVYRHIQKGYYTISPLDLPRAVKFKPRHSKASQFVPAWVKKGRRYEDYLAYIENHPGVPTVQFDTVIGKIGGKTIMTILFVDCDFMVGILLENKTAPEAASKISALKAELEKKGFPFSSIIPVILTDNGGEFSSVSAFENEASGNQETAMFFCDPNASYQKPHIEKNHTLFRDIVPSGSSFDFFTQDTVNLIFSHVNSVKRRQFNGKSAYDLFTFTYSVALASALGVAYIPADQVIQSPLLLAKSLSK